MIHQAAEQYLETLRDGWRDLALAVTALRGALPNFSNTQATLDNARGTVNRLAGDLETGLATLRRTNSDIATLVQTTEALLNQSRTEFNLLQPPLRAQLDALRDFFQDDPPAALLETEEAIESVDEAIRDGFQRFEQQTTEVGSRSSLHEINESVEDLGAYPLLTEDVGSYARTDPARGQVPPSELQSRVGGALFEVLGGRFRPGDPTPFLAALDRSFTVEEIDNRTVYKWTPRNYAVQTELGGALTGAQASLYHRAKSALDDALPLLDGLKPLSPSPDNIEVDAARAIVRTELIELVNELGVEGGPRVQRVDEIFARLRERLRDNTPFGLPQVFGFNDTNRIITVDEEQNLTNFLVVRDYVNDLFNAWLASRPFFTRTVTGQTFLGTQLVLLSRALTVVGESVQETNFTLDSVFIGPSERRTLTIRFPNGTPGNPEPMTIEELLSWVATFAGHEGPRLIQDGGRWGVQAVVPTAQRLTTLVNGAAKANVSPGFNTPRVKRTFQELGRQLQGVVDLGVQLGNRPTPDLPIVGGDFRNRS